MSHRTLAVVVAFAAVASFVVSRETDIDFWWHLETGRLIWESGAVPRADPFSFTAAGRPWVAHEWLWEWAIYAIYSVGGYRLAVLISAVAVSAAYALVYRLARRLGANQLVAAAVMLWAAGLALPNIGVRPRELTHLFLALFLHQVLLYRKGLVRHLWLLPVVMLVWVNVHGAFVLGIGLLVLYAAGEVCNGLARGEVKVPTHLLAVIAATVVAAVINPWGPAMLLYPFNYYMAEANPSFAIVTEFQSPNFHEPLLLLFCGGLIAMMVLRRRERVDWVEAALLAGFVSQALVSARQVSVCAIVMAPFLATRLCEASAWARSQAEPSLPPIMARVNVGLLALLLVAATAYAARPDVYRHLQLGAEPRSDNLPLDGASYIEDHDLAWPLFHHQAWGGYLIHRWYPQRKVFIDGRIDMYGPAICTDYSQVALIKPGWSEVLDEYEIRTVLMPRGSALSVLLRTDPGWRVEFAGDTSEIFVRAEPGSV